MSESNSSKSQRLMTSGPTTGRRDNIESIDSTAAAVKLAADRADAMLADDDSHPNSPEGGRIQRRPLDSLIGPFRPSPAIAARGAGCGWGQFAARDAAHLATHSLGESLRLNALARLNPTRDEGDFCNRLQVHGGRRRAEPVRYCVRRAAGRSFRFRTT